MKDVRVSLGTKIVYGLSCSANNLHIHFDTFFLTYFLTDVFNLSAAFIAFMFLITRLFDAFNDPIEGFIIDHTRTRWGRFRTFLLVVPIPFALIRIFLYASPHLAGWARDAYVFVLYVIGGSAASFIGIALNALLASMTQDTKERNALSGWYISLGLVTTLFVSSASIPLIDLFSDERSGFFMIVIIFSTVATAFYYLAFAKTREHFTYEKKDYPLKQTFQMIRRNKPLLILCLSNLFAMGINVVVIAAAIYFFKYYVKQESLYPLYMLVLMGSVVIASAFTSSLANRLGKTRLYMLASLCTMLGAALLFLTPASNLLLVFLFSMLIGFGSAPPFVLLFSMGADTVEYGELANGIRAEGLTMSMIGLTIKISGALAGALVALVLQVTGYVANAVQTPLALFGIKCQMTLIPFAFALLALIFIRFYKLDNAEYLKVLKALGTQAESPVLAPAGTAPEKAQTSL